MFTFSLNILNFVISGLTIWMSIPYLAIWGVNVYICRSKRVVRNTIFRKAPPSVVSGYGKRSINLNKVVATFEKHIFLSQTDLTRTGIISNSYNEMFEVLIVSFYVSTATFCFAPLWRMGPRCSSTETQVCHRSYIIAAMIIPACVSLFVILLWWRVFGGNCVCV